MPRLRALIAVLLAVTWCSAAWHVGLEAAGLMFEHEHHVHGDHDSDHAPTGAPDGHEDVFARDGAKGQVRAAAGAAGWILLSSVAAWLTAQWRPSIDLQEPPGPGMDADPPLARVWQFVWRCAPKSAAPPALG